MKISKLLLAYVALSLTACGGDNLLYPRSSYDNSEVCESLNLSFRVIEFEIATEDLQEALGNYASANQRYWVNGDVDPAKAELYIGQVSRVYLGAHKRWYEAYAALEECKIAPSNLPDWKDPQQYYPRIDVPGP